MSGGDVAFGVVRLADDGKGAGPGPGSTGKIKLKSSSEAVGVSFTRKRCVTGRCERTARPWLTPGCVAMTLVASARPSPSSSCRATILPLPRSSTKRHPEPWTGQIPRGLSSPDANTCAQRPSSMSASSSAHSAYAHVSFDAAAPTPATAHRRTNAAVNEQRGAAISGSRGVTREPRHLC